MRAAIIGISLVALLWSGYWLIGSRGATQETRDWLAARTLDGWTAEADNIRTRGFPNRFDTTLTATRLATPAAALAWSAPFLQILRLSYKPEHAIVIFPDRQIVRLFGTEVTVTTGRMRASVVFAPAGTDLDRANLAADDLSATLESGPTLTAATTLAAIRQTPARPLSYDVSLDLRALSLAGFGPGDPVALTYATAGATLTLTAPLAPGATITDIAITQLNLSAPAFTLRASGDLSVARDGLPTGTLTLETDDWLAVLDMATGLGLLSEDTARAIAPQTGAQTQLVIQRGSVFLGAVPLN